MNVFLAGWQSGNGKRERRLIDAGVIKGRCFSFANTVPMPGFPWHLKGVVEGYHECVASKVPIMMDSGVYSFRTYRRYLEGKGKSTAGLPTLSGYVRLYVDYCLEFGKLWDFYVTVDFTHDSEANYLRHVKLEKMGIRPAPVFHGDSSFDYLKRYADRGYKLVCLGSTRKLRAIGSSAMHRYLDGAFEAGARYGIEFHGLAMTSPWVMLGYPWRSVDSSSWSRVAGFGSILGWDAVTCRMTTLHVSKRHSTSAKLHGSADATACVRAHVTAQGYDFEKLRRNLIYRHQYNADTMVRVMQTATAKHNNSTDYRWRHLL